ncbi:RNA repair transcriptional activator RtcR [Derxia lacustris]|uniref:RNA repair transcriptional activator RtcR n=1 Tax=Derxia lacustris TaxID=764842 RepID=UPI000A17305B|nr:RNA repair transcriptional activator RtcR [Derxia lacustris]
MAAKPNVVIGFLGTQLDAGGNPGRWEKWRPTVSLAQHEDQVLDRLELLHSRSAIALARRVAADIAAISPETTVNLHELELADPWDFGEVYAALYDWVRAYPFDPEREDYRAHITTGTHVVQICLFLLVEARFFPGVLLQSAPPRRQRAGAAGTLTLIDLDLSRYDRIAARFHREQRDAVAFLKSGIATRNARFNALIEEIERVAVRSRAPVLLVGPTGAGKSHLARRMFELKKARHQLEGGFVEVNCATLRGDGAASALFGHRKGAFTGAASDRAGLLRTAHRGLLFLDEIGELGRDEQAMLLKAIEEKRFFPVGADAEVSSDFQLVAGTNRDLRAEVAAGRFRDDLFARINLWTYALPGLAERPEDIEPNVEHLLALAAQENGRAVRFNVEARARYLRFAQSAEASWRGNFRDLGASVTRLATLADGGRISEALVAAEIARLRWLWGASPPANGSTAPPDAAAPLRAALTAPGAPEPASAPPDAAIHAHAATVDLATLLGDAAFAELDLFDRAQLAAVVAVCRDARTLSDAGRRLFGASRARRSVVNDADRLRKYLARFDLDWERLAG